MRLIIIILISLNTVILNAQSNSDSIESRKLFDIASNFFYSDNDFYLAKKYAYEAINKDITNEEAHVLISWSYLFLNEYSNAIEYADLALKFNENNYYPFCIKAMAEYHLQNYNASIEYAKKAISLGLDDNIFVYQYKGLSHVKLGELRQGYEDLRLALKFGGDGEVYYQYAIAAYDLEEFEESMKYINTYIKNENSNIHAYLYRAKLYMEFGYFEEALADLTTYTEPLKKGQIKDEKLFVKSQPDVIQGFGISYAHLGEFDKAIKHFNESLQIEPSRLNHSSIYYSKSHFFLSIIYSNLDNLEKVKYHLKAMIELAPEEGMPYLLFAKIYFYIKDYDTALSYLNQIGDKTTDFGEEADYFKQIAGLYAQFDNVDKTVYYLLESFKNNPDDTETANDLIGLFNEFAPKYTNEYMIYFDIMALKFGENDNEKYAYFHAFKSMLYGENKEWDKVIEGLTRVIDIHPFSEYYAIRSLVYFMKYTELSEQKGQEKSLLKLKNQIFKDIDKALESNHRKADAYMLKITYLMYFEMWDETCKTAKEAIKLGATINKDQIKSICTGKEAIEKNSEWDINYNLSSWGERFSE